MQCESIGRVGSSACSCNTLIAHFWSAGSRTCSPRTCSGILFKIPAHDVWMADSSRSKDRPLRTSGGVIVTLFRVDGRIDDLFQRNTGQGGRQRRALSYFLREDRRA